MSEIIKTFFTESKKVASNVKNSIVPVNILYHAIIPAIVVAIILLYISVVLIKIPISGKGSYKTCTKWSDEEKKNCIQHENRVYDRKWHLLGYLIFIPLISVFMSRMWYKLVFYTYNPYIAAASYTYNAF